MLYRVKHTTAYDYNAPVSQCYNVAYLMPRETDYQRVLRSHITVQPNAGKLRQRQDYFGNNVCHFSLEKPHKKLIVSVESEIDKQAMPSLDLTTGATCGEVLAALSALNDPADIAASEFIYASNMIGTEPTLADFARELFTPEHPFLAAVSALNSRIFNEFEYDPNFSTVATPLADVLKHQRGVCQDFAHLAIACLRVLGFPARYVSGYLETLPPPGEEKLAGADASHAWFAVYAPKHGWVDFDPTNDCIPGEQHITTAWGRDYADVPPLNGVMFGGGSGQILDVSVDVARIKPA